MLSIKGVDKVELLYRLWCEMNPARFYTANQIPAPEFDHTTSQRAVTSYIDYYSGRAIKANLSGDSVDPRLYDRDASPGAFARILKTIKEET